MESKFSGVTTDVFRCSMAYKGAFFSSSVGGFLLLAVILTVVSRFPANWVDIARSCFGGDWYYLRSFGRRMSLTLIGLRRICPRVSTRWLMRRKLLPSRLRRELSSFASDQVVSRSDGDKSDMVWWSHKELICWLIIRGCHTGHALCPKLLEST